jgi:hypothetical protein
MAQRMNTIHRQVGDRDALFVEEGKSGVITSMVCEDRKEGRPGIYVVLISQKLYCGIEFPARFREARPGRRVAILALKSDTGGKKALCLIQFAAQCRTARGSKKNTAA